MINKFTVADVFRRFAPPLIKKGQLTPDQIKAVNLISVCKTAALGGHKESCDKCSYSKIHYNSCGNRHCPSCQGVNKERWILERSFDLIPVTYFHCVFTLPSELRRIALFNQKAIYDLLFTTVKDTLLAFGIDPRQKIMGKIGGISILHTWNQQMEYHPHLHVIVPNGGLNKSGQWVTSRGKDNFLFHVKALSKVFRGKFLHRLKLMLSHGQVRLSPDLMISDVPSAAASLIDKLFLKDWVVYSKHAFAGPQQVLEYLARYTHKICISNYRIVNITNTHVSFRYLDRKAKKSKVLTITGQQFVLRFVKHVLPKGFTKIRHFGFLASRCKSFSIQIIRQQLNVDDPPIKPDQRLSARQVMIASSGKDPYRCPCCHKGNLVITKIIPAIRGSPINRHLRFFPKDRIVKLEL